MGAEEAEEPAIDDTKAVGSAGPPRPGRRPGKSGAHAAAIH
jgi:hypothetical protein